VRINVLSSSHRTQCNPLTESLRDRLVQASGDLSDSEDEGEGGRRDHADRRDRPRLQPAHLPTSVPTATPTPNIEMENDEIPTVRPERTHVQGDVEAAAWGGGSNAGSSDTSWEDGWERKMPTSTPPEPMDQNGSADGSADGAGIVNGESR
jgi:hypothetical protein